MPLLGVKNVNSDTLSLSRKVSLQPNRSVHTVLRKISAESCSACLAPKFTLERNSSRLTDLTQSELLWKSATVWLSYSGANRPNSSYWIPTSSNAWVISWAAREGRRDTCSFGELHFLLMFCCSSGCLFGSLACR